MCIWASEHKLTHKFQQASLVYWSIPGEDQAERQPMQSKSSDSIQAYYQGRLPNTPEPSAIVTQETAYSR